MSKSRNFKVPASMLVSAAALLAVVYTTTREISLNIWTPVLVVQFTVLTPAMASGSLVARPTPQANSPVMARTIKPAKPAPSAQTKHGRRARG